MRVKELHLSKQMLSPLQIASLPKENGARGRTVVITQGALPTVVASQGKVSDAEYCHPVCSNLPETSRQITKTGHDVFCVRMCLVQVLCLHLYHTS